MKPILEIHNISKKFQINHEQQPYLSLRDSLTGIFKRKKTKEDFWALKDVTFDVMPGDAVGIIGRNGAGKSTLLKVLSKITPPTSGKIISRGRIASLLEVGTGFHSELTGRENVLMNGSILGMRRSEILKNFDAIVDFAGVQKFIDTPLKHYSSGMQLRLAFAVAAFLENEILIIDEVLAVGDVEFQKKCLGKMEDISKNQGRTVLFVSHNMDIISSLCKNGVLLSNGQCIESGAINEVIKKYLNINSVVNTIVPNSSKEAFISDFYLSEKNNYNTHSESSACFTIEIESKVDTKKVQVGIGINDIYGYRLVTPFTMHFDKKIELKKGLNSIKCVIDKLPLKPNLYNVEIYLGDGYSVFDYQKNDLQFEVLPNSKSDYLVYPNSSQGSFLISQEWQIN